MKTFKVAIYCLYFLIQRILTETYEDWIPKYGHRTDLKCPMDVCIRESLEISDIENCCVCRAIPKWAISVDTTILTLEYTRRFGWARIMGDVIETSRLIHNNGFLTKFPNNLCDFKNIVEIDVRYNKLSDITDLSCLQFLDTIDLSYNEIVAIRNSSFVNLPYLRVARITHNKVSTLEPFSLARPTLALFYADLSYNSLTKLDVSNMIPENNFCTYDFTFNKIDKLVNQNHFALNVSKVYDGGLVNLNSNQFTKFIDFSDLGINDITILGKVMMFGFSFQNMKLDCDCQMEPYLELSKPFIERIWRPYYNLTCWNPPEYRGLSIPYDFALAGRLNLLICNITDQCPRNCSCFYQPSNKRTVVNCTGAGYWSLPAFMPVSTNLTIILKDNTINKFESRDYLNYSFALDLSNNTIQSLPYDALSLLRDNVLLDLTDNKLKKLPRYLQKFDPCVVKFETITITCVCDDVWIGDWMRNKRAAKCKNITEIFCKTEKSVVSSLDVTRSILCDDDNYYYVNIVLPVLLAVLLVTVGATYVVLYAFRYELYLLRRKWTGKKSYKIHPVLKFDVFVSFFDDDAIIRTWIIRQLDPYLRLHGYKSFIPCRDSLVGESRDDALAETISSCKNYIIVLCNSYMSNDNTWTNKEWKYIWQNFKKNKERQIIIINYDQFDLEDIQDSKLKAFFRIGLVIDFANRKNTILPDIQKTLGQIMCTKPGLGNMRKKFSKHSLNNDAFFITI